jgi:hypothetical protein
MDGLENNLDATQGRAGSLFKLESNHSELEAKPGSPAHDIYVLEWEANANRFFALTIAFLEETICDRCRVPPA